MQSQALPRSTYPIAIVSSPRFPFALAPWDDPESARTSPTDLSTPGLRYRLAAQRSH